jgi:hypothetical protein
LGRDGLSRRNQQDIAPVRREGDAPFYIQYILSNIRHGKTPFYKKPPV